MTCICAIETNDGVYIGGDSAGIAGLSISIRDDTKVFQNGPFIFGFTSSFRMGQLLRFKFDPPQQTIHQDDYEYMVTDFVDGLRRCFSVNGFGDKDATEGGTFLVGYKGKLYIIQSDYQVGIPNEKFDAVGCGSDLALGSLHTTDFLKLKAEDRLVMALQAASKFSAGVAPPFVLIKQEKEEAPAPRPKQKENKTKSKAPTKTTPKVATKKAVKVNNKKQKNPTKKVQGLQRKK